MPSMARMATPRKIARPPTVAAKPPMPVSGGAAGWAPTAGVAPGAQTVGRTATALPSPVGGGATPDITTATASTVPQIPMAPPKPAWQQLQERGIAGGGSAEANKAALADAQASDPTMSFQPAHMSSRDPAGWKKDFNGNPVDPNRVRQPLRDNGFGFSGGNMGDILAKSPGMGSAGGDIESAIGNLKGQLGMPQGSDAANDMFRQSGRNFMQRGSNTDYMNRMGGDNPGGRIPSQPLPWQPPAEPVPGAAPGANPANPYANLLRQRLGAGGAVAGAALGL